MTIDPFPRRDPFSDDDQRTATRSSKHWRSVMLLAPVVAVIGLILLGVAISLELRRIGKQELNELRDQLAELEPTEPNAERADQPIKAEPGATAESAPLRPIDQLNSAGFSELHYAAMEGDVDRVRAALRAAANVDVRQGKFQGTPLQYAAHAGHVEVVKILLDAGATIDATDTASRTPLMWAAGAGRIEVVRLLIDRKANVNAKTKTNWTPLRYATSRGHDKTAELLVDFGAEDAIRTR